MNLEHKLIAPSCENEIIKQWRYTDKIYVSVLCITYNQEAYIRDALDSFLAQKTEYKFEIVVHDDASKDNTYKILSQYKQKFPNIVKVIQQNDNQYSKGRKVFPIAAEIAQGMFLALCEGDDFWVDESKIQRQLTKMLSREENISFHPVYYLVNDSFEIRNKKHAFFFDLDEVIKGGGAFMPTPSIMVRKKVFDSLPDFYFDAPVGDYYFQVLASAETGALYIDEPLSCYRYRAVGSYGQSMQYITSEQIRRKALNHEITLDSLNNYLSNICEGAIEHAKAQQMINYAIVAIKNKKIALYKELIKRSCSGKIISFKHLFLIIFGFSDTASKVLMRILNRRKLG